MKTFTADGIATSIVRNEKIVPATTDCPEMNMWWPQTRKPMTAMKRLEKAMKWYPKTRLREKAVMSSLITPIDGQDHDVDGGVRVEPEEVLEEDRVAAVLRVEDADVEEPLGADEEDRDGDDRRARGPG